jgi:hypothetical protein
MDRKTDIGWFRYCFAQRRKGKLGLIWPSDQGNGVGVGERHLRGIALGMTQAKTFRIIVKDTLGEGTHQKIW